MVNRCLIKNKKIRKFIILLLVQFSFLQAYSQTKQDIISEANRLEINSREKAIAALASKGISLSQAKEMAQLRGIDFDTFLDNYLKSNLGNVNTTTLDTITPNKVVTDLKVTKLPDQIISLPKAKVEKEIENYFGYDIFINNPFGKKEYLIGNIDEGYILAPGDELRITVFGDNNLEFVSKIDLNGNISFPNLGVFFAAGNSFATLKKRIKIFLGKYYSGLLATPSRTFLDVSLTQIRPVKVSILGNVNTPGPHLVNGMATVLNALYASGGVSTSGTLRDVKVYRNNKLIKTIDLYDYITQGNIDQDIRLSNNDVLFVGPRLTSITLKGQVKKSAIYELKPNESLKDLFRFSGGLSSSASLSNINISRIKPFKDREQALVFDRFLTTINYASFQKDPKKDFELTDGDLVTVQEILTKQKNQVFITGNVNVPGTFALDIFKDLKTLIDTGAKGLLPNTYMQKIDINKVDEQGNLSFKTYNLASVLNGEIKVSLQENDQIKIYSLKEVEGEQKVTISGYVTAPKTIFWNKDLSLFDLIFQAVSYDELEFQAKVLTSRLDLKRYDKNSGLYGLIQYSLSDLEGLKNTYLQPKDEIVLYTKSVTEDITPTVQIVGSVRAPGEFSLSKKMYIEDLILAAGGFLETAEKGFVYLNRLDRDLEKGSYSKLEVIEIDIDYMLGLKKTPAHSYVLENYDIITVTQPIRANSQPSISLRGEVKYPGKIVLKNDKIKLSELIEIAGGYTNNSNLKSSYVERDNLILFTPDKDGILNDKTILQDGDIVVIGSNLTSIKTVGGIVNPTSFSWEEGRRAKYYIKNSGGKKKRIDYITVRQANGKSEKVGFFKNPKIYPGAVITLVEKPEKIKGEGGKFLDDFIRVFGIITGTLTTILLATKL